LPSGPLKIKLACFYDDWSIDEPFEKLNLQQWITYENKPLYAYFGHGTFLANGFNGLCERLYYL
jgi:hypothetical protein